MRLFSFAAKLISTFPPHPPSVGRGACGSSYSAWAFFVENKVGWRAGTPALIFVPTPFNPPSQEGGIEVSNTNAGYFAWPFCCGRRLIVLITSVEMGRYAHIRPILSVTSEILGRYRHFKEKGGLRLLLFLPSPQIAQYRIRWLSFHLFHPPFEM